MAPKKKQEKMSLGEFLNNQSLSSWADEMDNQPLPTSTVSAGGYSAHYRHSGDRRAFVQPSWTQGETGTGVGVLKREGGASYGGMEGVVEGMGGRGASYDRPRFSDREPLPLPNKPPYMAHVGNLSYNVTTSDIEEFFKSCQVTNIRIVEDKVDHRPKGFGYVEFATVEGLQKALRYHEMSLLGRTVKISVAEPPKEPVESSRDFSDWERKGPVMELPQTQRQTSKRGLSRKFSLPPADDDLGTDQGWSTVRRKSTVATASLDVHDLTEHSFDQTSSYVDGGLEAPTRGPSLEPIYISDAENDLGDLDALLNPSKYFSELDDLERYAIDKCRLQSILPASSDGVVDVVRWRSMPPSSYGYDEFLLDESRSRWTEVFRGVRETTEKMLGCGFLGEGIIILVEDPNRSDVIKARTISTRDIIKLDSLDTFVPFDIDSLQRHIDEMLFTFGARPVVSNKHEEDLTQYGALRLGIELLCLLLPLAVVSYAGSHCSNFALNGWGTTIGTILFHGFEGMLQDPSGWRGRQYSFRRRRLTCLDDYVGSSVWTFGSMQATEKFSLSIYINQFADLWGPLYTIPSITRPEDLIAIHTEGGILFRKGGSADFSSRRITETPIHWIASAPVHKRRGRQGMIRDRVMTSAKNREWLPTSLASFSSSQPLLIGTPTTSANAATLTNQPNVDTTPRLALALQLTSEPGLIHNTSCDLDLEEYGRLNTFRLHAVGTSSEYYLPEEYQLGFGGGQYVNVGIQKVYKRRPAITYKTRILECFSKPRNLGPKAVQTVLKCFLGLEVSACTRNAQRATLQDTLRLAYPQEIPAIEQACNSGDGQEVLRFLYDLENTGVSHDSKANLFWPLSTGLREVLELPDLPSWLTLLKDTRDSACFAVASPRCLPFNVVQDQDPSYRRLCSRERYLYSDKPAFLTTIELNPDIAVPTPLKRHDRLQLPFGQLQIQSQGTPTQLAFFKRKSRWNTGLNSRREGVHRELLNGSRKSLYTASLLIMEQP